MTSDRIDERRPASDATRRWAPWWVYVLVILGGNYLRQAIVPFGTVPQVVDVLLAVAIAAVLFVVVTAVHRGLRRPR